MLVVFTRERLSPADLARLQGSYVPFDRLITGGRASGILVTEAGTIGTRLQCDRDTALIWAHEQQAAGVYVAVMEFCREYQSNVCVCVAEDCSRERGGGVVCKTTVFNLHIITLTPLLLLSRPKAEFIVAIIAGRAPAGSWIWVYCPGLGWGLISSRGGAWAAMTSWDDPAMRRVEHIAYMISHLQMSPMCLVILLQMYDG